MSSRWRDPATFRADPAAAASTRPSRRQSAAMLAVFALALAAVVVASYAIRPDRARAFQLLHGSVFLADSAAPVAVDLASGKPTFRLNNAAKQVGSSGALDVVPARDATVLLDPATGEFNMVDSTGFVIKHDGGGVPLARRSDATTSAAYPTGVPDVPGQAYLVRSGPGGTDVYLVDETVVQTAAADPRESVKPRASADLKSAVADIGSGGVATSAGDLWLLADESGARTLQRLTLPAGSRPGAALHEHRLGTVDAVSAVASATGTGTTSVAVAEPDRIRFFGGAEVAERDLAVSAPLGTDAIVPVTAAQGRLAFLVHAADGWYVESLAADGTDLRQPEPVAGVPAAAKLSAPAMSAGALFTTDENDGRIYRIAMDGQGGPVLGAASYPLVSEDGHIGEQARFPDVYVLADGPRVFVDSPSHAYAVAIFTDGSHRPLRIEKASAVTVDAASGADALTKATIDSTARGRTARSRGTTPKKAGQPINNNIDCKAVTQKPHIPQLHPGAIGSRSVTLSWIYPAISQQDCVPSTYVVSVRSLGDAAPSPGGTVTVQGQTSTVVTGLYPQSPYSITVTAYLNGEGTSSPPITVTTGKEGPAAPTHVDVAATADGNWHLTWDGCGGVAQGCVPVSSWTVTPSVCGAGTGLADPGALVSPADTSARAQPAATYRGGDALLGRGLRFVITGTGESGTGIGAPSARTPCVYSHSAPRASTLTVYASRPPVTAFGASTATKVRLDLGPNPVRDLGGIGTAVTFALSDGTQMRTSAPVVFAGAQTSLSATFDGVRAGATYTASATVTPAHGGGAVTVVALSGVTTSESYPAVTMNPTCDRSADQLSCELKVTLAGLPDAATNGEKFDFAATLTCDKYGLSLTKAGIEPGDTLDFGTLDQRNGAYGSCKITGATLAESAGYVRPLFGGVVDTLPSADVSLDPPVTAGAGSGDFAASWSTRDGSSAEITYTGGNALLPTLTTGWRETLRAPDGTDCSNPIGDDVPGAGDDSAAYVPATASCVDAQGDDDSWTVDVTYTDTVGGASHSFTLALAGKPPSYQICAPTGFSAQWGATIADGVDVTQSADDDHLAGCSAWRYTLVAPDGSTCTTSDDAPTTPPPVTIPISCGTAPSSGDWTVTVTWTDTAGNPRSADQPLVVDGDPPTD